MLLTRFLEVDAGAVHVQQLDPPDERFSRRFFISRRHEEDGRDWSKDAEMTDDLLSVISIGSIPYTPEVLLEDHSEVLLEDHSEIEDHSEVLLEDHSLHSGNS